MTQAKKGQSSHQGSSAQAEFAKQLQWQCRRGMLELDVILGPFLSNHFSSLTAHQQSAFVQLLKEPDPDLYTWFMGYGECSSPDKQEIIQIIKDNMLQ